jgi:hypothetical protein
MTDARLLGFDAKQDASTRAGRKAMAAQEMFAVSGNDPAARTRDLRLRRFGDVILPEKVLG